MLNPLQTKSRIVLDRNLRSKRSESLSISSEKAKNTIKKNLNPNRSLNLNKYSSQKIRTKSPLALTERSFSLKRPSASSRPLIKDLRSIEKKEFNVNLINEKVSKKLDSETRIYQKSLKTNPLCNLMNRTKLEKLKSPKKSNKKSKEKDLLRPTKLERSRSQEEFSRNSKMKGLIDDELDQVGGYQLYSREILMSRAKRKTLKVTILIIVAFLACWSPYVRDLVAYLMTANLNPYFTFLLKTTGKHGDMAIGNGRECKGS